MATATKKRPATKKAHPVTPLTPKAADTTCNARTKGGGYCKLAAGFDTQHPGFGRCNLHGGSEPRAQVNGVVELARREARVMGIPLDIDPHNAILGCIRIAAGEVKFASDKIADLSEAELLVRPLSGHQRPMKTERGGEDPDRLVNETQLDAEELNIWVKVRHGAMDRLVRYSAAAIKAGVEQRAVEIAESQGAQLVIVIRGALHELGVGDHPDVAQVVRRQLTLVAGTG